MKSNVRWSWCGTTSLLISIVTLMLLGPLATAGPIFAPSYSESISFADGLPQSGPYHPMGIAHDGTHYWTVSGGSANGQRLSQHNGTNGDLIATFSPGLSFYSVFTNNDGDVFARIYNNRRIKKQTSPGVFEITDVYFARGTIDSTTAVVYDNNNSEYIARKNGVVTRWDQSGQLINTVNLIGYGTMNNEGSHSVDTSFASFGDYWLTYSESILSAWDHDGNRIEQTTLIGAGTTLDSHFSLSYANDMVFINDGDDLIGTWRGYEVPEPATLLLFSLGGVMLRKRGKII